MSLWLGNPDLHIYNLTTYISQAFVLPHYDPGGHYCRRHEEQRMSKNKFGVQVR